MKFRPSTLITTLVLIVSNAASAANFQWDVNGVATGLGGTGTWDTSSLFWDLLGTAPDDGTAATTAYTFTSADIAVFGGTAGTVTLGTGVTVNGLKIDTVGYIITGNTLSLAGTTPTITANTNASISSALAGSAGLVKDGTGNLTLSGNNTFTGGTTVNAGTLTLSRGAGFGGNSGSISTGSLTVNSGAIATTTTAFAISGDTSGTNARVVNVSGTLNLAASEYIKTYNLTGGIINAPTAAGDYLRASTAGLFINSLASAATSTINNKIDLTFASATIDTANGTASSDLTITGVISENTGAGSGAKTITKSGAGTLTLTGVNTFTGSTTITGGTLAIGGAGRLANGTYAGAVAISTGAVFSVESSAAQVMSGVISGQGSLIKGGTGVLTLSGTAVNTYTGGTTLNRGTLFLDNANLTTPTNLLNSSTVLTLGGGTLTVKGKTGAFATSQTVASTTLNPGASTARVEQNTGTSTTLNLGAITRNQGATLNVTAESNLSTTSSTSQIIKTTGITYNGNAVALPGAGLKKYVGAGFLANSGTSTRFAQIDEFGQFVAPPTATGWISTGGDTTTVYNASSAGAAAAGATLTGATTMYGTVFNAGAATTQGLDTFNLTTNGLLNISTGTVTISGSGKVLAGTERDLVVHTASTGGFNISSVIDNSAAGASSLTFSGQSTGILTLNHTAANTYSGGTYISAGTLSIGTGGTGTATANVAALGTGTVTINPGGILRLWIKNDASFTIANNLSINGGTLRNEDGNHTMSGTVAVGTGGATFQAVYSGKNLLINNTISGSGPVTVEGNGGQVRFLGNNTYTGETTVSNGTLVLSSANASSGFSIASGASLALRAISLGATQNITGAGNVTKDISTFGGSTIAGTNNNYTGTTNVNIDRFTLASGGVINGTSSITVLGQWSARYENLGTTTTPGGVTANGYAGSGSETDAGIFYNGNSAGTTPGTLSAASITLDSSFRSNATTKAKGGEFFNYANSTVNLSSGAITVNGQGNALAGGMVSVGSTFNNAGSVTAGSITLNSSSTANTASNKGGTYTQTGGITTLSGTATLAANGGTGAAGTAGNDAAFNLSGGTFSAGTLAVNSGTVTATGGNLNLGAGGITSTGANTIAVNLGATTVGATANWTSSVPMTLSDTTTGTTFATAGGNIGLSGALSGNGKLVKTNSGTLTLTGTNTYTGLTTVSAGTLALSGAGSLSDSTKVNIATSSVFDIAGITSSSETIGSLVSASGSSISLGAKVLDIGSDGSDFSSEGDISGSSGGIKKSGNGILTLKGNNTYIGDTNISQGTLLLGANNVLPAGSALSLSGATVLKTGGFSTTAGPLSVTGGVDIDLGSGATSIVTFSNIGTWSGMLNIWNYSGGAVGVGSTGDKLIFTAQSGTFNLANVQFYTGNIGDTGSQLGAGAGFVGSELVPIPEPSTALVAFVLLGFVCLRARRTNGR